MSGQLFVKCSNRHRDLRRYQRRLRFAGRRFGIDLRAWRYQLEASAAPDSLGRLCGPVSGRIVDHDRFRGVRLPGSGFLTEDRSDLSFTALGLSFKPMEKRHISGVAGSSGVSSQKRHHASGSLLTTDTDTAKTAQRRKAAARSPSRLGNTTFCRNKSSDPRCDRSIEQACPVDWHRTRQK